jgi:hypothetical protein
MVHLHGPSGHLQHNSGTHIRTWIDGTDMIRWDTDKTSTTKLKRNLDKYNTNSVDSRQYSGQLNDRIRIRIFYSKREFRNHAEPENLRKIFSVVPPLMTWNIVIQWMDFSSLKQIHFVQSIMFKQTGCIFWPLELHEDQFVAIFFPFLGFKIEKFLMDPKFIRNK